MYKESVYAVVNFLGMLYVDDVGFSDVAAAFFLSTNLS